MTIEKTIYERHHYIYYDSTQGYDPQIGDVVKYDPDNYTIEESEINICGVFDSCGNGDQPPVKNYNAGKETPLGDLHYTTDGVSRLSGGFQGTVSVPGLPQSVGGENEVSFTDDGQSVFKFVNAKKIIYDSYCKKEKMIDRIRLDIQNYDSGRWYGVVYGRVKCDMAYTYQGIKHDRVFNVAADSKFLSVLKVHLKSALSYKSKKAGAVAVKGRPDAVVGIYIFPFKVGSKKDLFGRPHEPKIKIMARGPVARNDGDSGDATSLLTTTPTEDINSLSDELDVYFDEEALKREM